MKVRITGLDFEWDYPPEDPVAPDHEMRNELVESVIDLPEDIIQSIEKDQDVEEDLIVCEYITDWIGQRTNFPIKELSWEVWGNTDN